MRILLIEDEPQLSSVLTLVMQANGYEVDACLDGETGLDYMLENAHDLVILDHMLPKRDGISVLKSARAFGVKTPVLMFTAMGKEINQISGLDCGADDYLIKPVSNEVLLAHIRALLRRPIQVVATDIMVLGDIRLEAHERLLIGPCGNCHLSSKETSMLILFLKNPGATLSREMLLNKIWGLDATISDGNLTNYIFLLRRHLTQVGSKIALNTLHNLGYGLETQ